ncbi:MAG: hypothetical protein RL661_538 [Pseudomonadota bacterium]|jgi:hypothetical protein
MGNHWSGMSESVRSSLIVSRRGNFGPFLVFLESKAAMPLCLLDSVKQSWQIDRRAT